jgi:hypothetical protein
MEIETAQQQLQKSTVSNIFPSRVLRIAMEALNLSQGIFTDYKRFLREYDELRHFEGNNSAKV